MSAHTDAAASAPFLLAVSEWNDFLSCFARRLVVRHKPALFDRGEFRLEYEVVERKSNGTHYRTSEYWLLSYYPYDADESISAYEDARTEAMVAFIDLQEAQQSIMRSNVVIAEVRGGKDS